MKELAPFEDPIDGVTFVEASAGTGKTYAIEMLYLRLVVEHGMTPEQIAVVTYTNAAAAEMRRRIRQRLRRALDFVDHDSGDRSEPWQAYIAHRRGEPSVRQRLLGSLFDFDRAAIWTIHGFCQRVLVEHAFDSGAAFDLEMITDQTAVVDEVVRDFVAAELGATPRPLLAAVWGSGALGEMTRFAARVAAQPDLIVDPDGEEWRPTFARWAEVFAAAQEVWETERTAIAARRADPVLNANSRLDDAKLDEHVSKIWDLSGLFGKGRRESLERLTARRLRDLTRKGSAAPQHRFFDLCQELFDLEPPLEHAFHPEVYQALAAAARREIPRRKAAARQMYFDDLLLALHAALRGPSGSRLADKLRQRFHAALIDEFQDTDPVQYEIFRDVFAGQRPMFLIGDPKQSIYAFRGADVYTYVAAGHGATRRATLSCNRRSHESVVTAVNELFATPQAFVLPGIDFSAASWLRDPPVPLLEGSPGLTLLRYEGGAEKLSAGEVERQSCAGVASQIVRLLRSAARVGGVPLRAGGIAVLCRTNDQCARVQEQLRERGVPSVLQGDRSVFDTDEAPEMSRVLQALVEPRDAGAIRAALCTGLCGLSGDEMMRVEEDETEWQKWSDRFHRWRARWDEDGFMAAFRQLQDECETWAKLLERDGGERRLTNYLHLGELLQVASRLQRGGAQGLLDWLALMTSDAGRRGEMAAEDLQVRLESEEDAVVVTTVHKSKGLEYPVVFLPFAWRKVALIGDDEKFPRDHTEGRRRVYVGVEELEARREAALVEQLAEEMRLTYVGLTRARHACFAVVADIKGEAPMQRLAADAEALCGRTGGAVAIEKLAADDTRLARSDEGRQVVPPPPPPAIVGGWRVSSFSGLTRRDEKLAFEEEEGIDRDAVTEPISPVTGGADEAVVLAELDGGTRVGLMLHSVFEDIDFRSQDAAATRRLVEAKVRDFRGRNDSVDAICRSVADVLGSPLPGRDGDLSLSSVSTESRLNELEFILPVRGGGSGRLLPSMLAEVLARHRFPVVDGDYAERVARLGFTAFAGFLRGFVDMVFLHRGHWYVVDYKSNFLGTRWRDYVPSRLREPMAHHHYYLQYLLYVVAVDRYLARRVADYSYERCFGGVFYCFLRGMAPNRPLNGVYHDRPSPALIADLSRLFAGEAVDG